MQSLTLKTVEWKNNSVIMIDQTKLPGTLEFVTYTDFNQIADACLLYTSPSPRDATLARMPSSA